VNKGPHIRVSPSTHQKLARLSEEYGIPMSQIVERLLQEKEDKMALLTRSRMKIVDAIEEGRVKIVYNEPDDQ
jgi:hypothetical protein